MLLHEIRRCCCLLQARRLPQERREAGFRGDSGPQREIDVVVARLVAGIFARVAAQDKGEPACEAFHLHVLSQFGATEVCRFDLGLMSRALVCSLYIVQVSCLAVD